MASIHIPVEAECWECGQSLSVKSLEMSNDEIVVSVALCNDCVQTRADDAEEKGYAKGLREGEESCG